MARTTKDVFVGIDAGTTGSKVALFDACGNELGGGYCEYPCIYRHPGWVEQDVEEVWRGIFGLAVPLASLLTLRMTLSVRSDSRASADPSFFLMSESIRSPQLCSGTIAARKRWSA